MNWRSVRIQTDGADIAIVPNSVVAKGLIINRSVPTPRRAASVDIPTVSSARSETLSSSSSARRRCCRPKLLGQPGPSIGEASISGRPLDDLRDQLLRRLVVRSGDGAKPAAAAGVAHVAPRRVGPGPGAEPDGVAGSARPLRDADARPDRAPGGQPRPGHRSRNSRIALYEQGTVGASIYIVAIRRARGRPAGRSWRPVARYGRVGPGEDISARSA